MKKLTGILSAFAVFIFLSQCQEGSTSEESNQPSHPLLDIPTGFPEPDIPEDNQLTAERIALGKKLFFDPILSLDTSISCGSCHFQKYAFSDSVPISMGVHGQNGLRNAPPLFNLAYRKSFFRDGGVPTLEMQVIAPIQTEEEMHLNILDAVDRLKNHPEYPALIKEAYNREPDAFTVTRAIAAFERTLISGNSKYDQYYYQNNPKAMNDMEIAGMELFFGDKLKCSSCHSGFNFTSDEQVNNGLYENYDSDPGKMRITLDKVDEGKFKIPSLRNVMLTGPYMHDGSYTSIDSIIDHYASGGSNHPVKSPLISGFEINNTERKQLIAFLSALTDEEFLKNKAYNP